jgi:hypothetical protein
VKRPPELGPKREPSPIHLSYYANNRPGIRTFANAPVAIYPEDLIAGKVDIAMIAPVEALIALSIVLVARGALLARTAARESASITRAALIVVTFGLIHGLGFASALGKLGIERAERWAALVFFNIGVEIGQVLFVLALVGLFAVLRPPRLRLALRSLALYCAGITGVFWLGERIAGFS